MRVILNAARMGMGLLQNTQFEIMVNKKPP